VVVLVDERSVEGSLKAARRLGKKSKEGERYVWGEGVAVSSSGKARGGEKGEREREAVPSLGSARYAAHQRLRFPSKLTLQQNVDAFMTTFNALEGERALEAKRTRNVPDEDGFVTVVRGGSRSGPARMEDAERKRVELEKKEEEKRGQLRKGDFYRFQGRERRKGELGELVKAFEGDRRRVEELKARKGGRGGFRPEK